MTDKAARLELVIDELLCAHKIATGRRPNCLGIPPYLEKAFLENAQRHMEIDVVPSVAVVIYGHVRGLVIYRSEFSLHCWHRDRKTKRKKKS